MGDIGSYLQRSTNNAKSSVKEWQIFGDVGVFIKDPLVGSISIKNVLHRLQEAVPTHLAYGLDSIYIGEFKEFEQREISAFYEAGTIYVSNIQDNDDDMVDDIVHEIAHLVEETQGLEIYGDDRIEAEFLGKRRRLYQILVSEGYDVDLLDFIKPEFSREFDEFLHKKVGYVNLEPLTRGLFYSPYGATSLKEYFANGFEAFFFKKDTIYLRDLSPILYNKLEKLLHAGE